MSPESSNSQSSLERRSLARLNFLFTVLLLTMAVLAVRLATMVRRGQAAAVRYVERQQRMVVPIPARPGGIWAHSGQTYRLLAGSKQSPGCYVDAALISDAQLGPVIGDLAEAVEMDPAAVREIIMARRDGRFVWIKRDLTDAQAQAVKSLNRLAVGISHEWRREYPNGALAATLLGFRRRDGEAGGGLELALQEHLAAVDGREVMVADAQRRPIWLAVAETIPPRDGDNVYLTIDLAVQSYLAEAVAEAVDTFEAKWGVGVVVQPTTGRILAMCSAPSFDPHRYQEAQAAHRANRAIDSPFEPGSVAKPLFAAAAVDQGLANYQTLIDCEDGSYYARRGGRITDHGKAFGEMTLEDVVVFSSNIGMAKIGERLGNGRLHAAAMRYGFGAKTGIGLPGESAGIVRPADQWNGYSLRRVPFGQEISVSALQLAMAFSALANGGQLLRPQLVDHVRDASNQVVWRGERQVVRRVVSARTAAQAVAVMEQVVQRGTGKACRLDRWSSFGKTGTGQIPGPGGYVEGAYTGSFVGGAPVRSPRVVCLISVYWPNKSKGYYGSKVAAPYVRKVLSRTLAYLDVPPDTPDEQLARAR